MEAGSAEIARGLVGCDGFRRTREGVRRGRGVGMMMQVRSCRVAWLAGTRKLTFEFEGAAAVSTRAFILGIHDPALARHPRPPRYAVCTSEHPRAPHTDITDLKGRATRRSARRTAEYRVGVAAMLLRRGVVRKGSPRGSDPVRTTALRCARSCPAATGSGPPSG